MLQFYALNELILNLMPATDLKIVGTGACLPWCSISSLFKTVSGVLVFEFGSILAWYSLPAAEEFVVNFAVFSV